MRGGAIDKLFARQRGAVSFTMPAPAPPPSFFRLPATPGSAFQFSQPVLVARNSADWRRN